MFFSNRTAAGRQLAGELARLGLVEPVVLGLPRGGAPVAAEVARLLGAPLDVIVVRKLGVPFQPEVAFGAIGEGGVRLINGATVRAAGLGEWDCTRVEEAERAELERRQARYRRGGNGSRSPDGRWSSWTTASPPDRPRPWRARLRGSTGLSR
ncbi:hypothetical protein GCM10020254_81600 [Streptomyces goshikiensis]